MNEEQKRTIEKEEKKENDSKKELKLDIIECMQVDVDKETLEKIRDLLK